MAYPEYSRGVWPDDTLDTLAYGLGWDNVAWYPFCQSGIQALAKGGDTLYYHAALVVLPEYDMAAAVVSSGGVSTYNQLAANQILIAALAEEDDIYREAPNAKQADYIRRLVKGVDEHGAELDGYIAKYAKGWNFARIPLVASAIMRVAMYEILYMPDIPNGAAINEAVEIAKKYETPETVKFINGILGSFVRQEISE